MALTEEFAKRIFDIPGIGTAFVMEVDPTKPDEFREQLEAVQRRVSAEHLVERVMTTMSNAAKMLDYMAYFLSEEDVEALGATYEATRTEFNAGLDMFRAEYADAAVTPNLVTDLVKLADTCTNTLLTVAKQYVPRLEEVNRETVFPEGATESDAGATEPAAEPSPPAE